MDIHNYQGQVYEERHSEGVCIATQPMTGTIVSMEWRPTILRVETRPEGFTVGTIEGYGPGTPILSTDFDDRETDWVFQFTVETNDPIPEPRKL